MTCKTLLHARSLPTPHAVAVAIVTVIVVVSIGCASLSWLQKVVNVVFQLDLVSLVY